MRRPRKASQIDEAMVEQIGLRRTVLCYHGPDIAAKTWKEKKALEAMLVHYSTARNLDDRFYAVRKALHIKNNQWALICGHAQRVPGLISPPEMEGGFPVFNDLVSAKAAAPIAKARAAVKPAPRSAASQHVHSPAPEPAPASNGLKSTPDGQPRVFNIFARAGGRHPASDTVRSTQVQQSAKPVAPRRVLARRPLCFKKLPPIWEHDSEEQNGEEATESRDLSMRSHDSQPTGAGDQEGVLSSGPAAVAVNGKQSIASQLSSEPTQGPTGSPAGMGGQKMIPGQIHTVGKLADQQLQVYKVPAIKDATCAPAQMMVPQLGSLGSGASSEASKTALISAFPPLQQKKCCLSSAAANIAELLPNKKKEKKTLKSKIKEAAAKGKEALAKMFCCSHSSRPIKE